MAFLGVASRVPAVILGVANTAVPFCRSEEGSERISDLAGVAQVGGTGLALGLQS